jgi:hypothetical protein
MSATREADSTGPLLLCYDGSRETTDAITYAGQLLRGSEAVVVSIWKEVIEETLSTGMTRPVADLVEANKREREAADRFAAEGVRFARRAGLRARQVVVEADRPRWEAVERVAEDGTPSSSSVAPVAAA